MAGMADPTPSPARIGVLVCARRLDVAALRYLVTRMNALQHAFEFEFLPTDCDVHPLPSLRHDRRLRSHRRLVDPDVVREQILQSFDQYPQYLRRLNKDFGLQETPPSYFVIVSTARLAKRDNEGRLDDSYWFTMREANVSVLALGNWRRAMAPPSVLEFILTLLVREAGAAVSQPLRGSVHLGSKGCLFDFCFDVHDTRLKVLNGFVCDFCRRALVADGLGSVADALPAILDRSWLGKSTDPALPAGIASNLGFDLFQSKGLRKTAWDSFLAGVQGELTKQLVRIAGVVAIGVLALVLGLRL
jgi:hypothetical protein